MDKLHGSLNRALGGLKFDQRMKRAVTERRTERPIRRRTPLRAAALAVCAVLVVTAAAAGPGIWETIRARQGGRAPYAQTLGEAACTTEQGITIQVLSAVTDGYSAEVYYTLTDPQGRLGLNTQAAASLSGEGRMASSRVSSRLLAWEEEEKTVLMRTGTCGVDFSQPAELRILELSPASYSVAVKFDPPAAGEPLQTTEIDGQQLAVPGQSNQSSPETEDFYLSSAGFDGQGRFQALVAFRGGCQGSGLYVFPYGAEDQPLGSVELVQTENGTYSLADGVAPEQIAYLLVRGVYTGPEGTFHGPWSIPLELEPAERREIAVNREIGGYPVGTVQVSPLGVTVFYDNDRDGRLIYSDDAVQIQRKDGGTAAAVLDLSGLAVQGEPDAAYPCYSVWSLEEPVELDDIAGISLMGEVIWTSPDAGG